MYKMDLKHKPLGPLKAAGVVAGLVVAILLLSVLGNLYYTVVPGMALWLYIAAALLVFFIYKRYVVAFRYALSEKGRFSVERLAGQRAKPVVEIELGEVIFYGDPSMAPAADKHMRFVLRDAPYRQRALVTEEGLSLLIQPDDELDELIREGVAGASGGQLS